MTQSLTIIIALVAMARVQPPPSCTPANAGKAEAHEYFDALTQYRHGDATAAVERIHALAPEDVDEAIKALERDAASVPGCLQAAALLHTELALRAIEELVWLRAYPQLDIVRALIDSIPRVERERFLRDWLLTMAWFHQRAAFTVNAIYGFTQAREYFGQATQTFPQDAEVTLAAGSLFEWAGSLRLGQASHLKEAQRLYERSLDADPDIAEANLRYGSVLEKRGDYDRAYAATKRVLELDSEEVVLYRAHMTLGNLDERAGRPDGARQHYQRAIEIRPDWQVAYLALGHCLHRQGARAGSQEILDQMFSLTKTEDSALGWWRYELGLSRRFEAHLERMRTDVAF